MGWQTLGIFDFHSADDGMTCMSLGTCSSTQLLMTSFYFDSAVGGMTFKSLGSFHSIRTLMDEFLFHSALDGMACKWSTLIWRQQAGQTRRIRVRPRVDKKHPGINRSIRDLLGSHKFSRRNNTPSSDLSTKNGSYSEWAEQAGFVLLLHWTLHHQEWSGGRRCAPPLGSRSKTCVAISKFCGRCRPICYDFSTRGLVII